MAGLATTGFWVDGILTGIATMVDASDLVLEPQDDGSLKVRARIAGLYRTLESCPATGASAAIARLKALAGVPAYIVDEPQDGRIDGRPFGIAGDLRAAFIPTVRGSRAAIRLPAMGELPNPDGLGLPAAVVAGLRQVMSSPQGLLLVCGPTGSGKTTTIHSLLAELATRRPDRLPLTIEDPVERRLTGVVQVEVATHREFGFAEALRAAVRQDPDVLVIGEIRDPSTAQAAVRAVLTGHLVVTSLHCSRASEALPRLIEMGVAPELILPALSGVLAQRLVRTLHVPCAGRGCPKCHAGFLGRRAIADWTMPQHSARVAWVAGTPPPLIADLDDQAAALIVEGVTRLTEVERAIGQRQ
jgi:type II secretory ATPase GspE/PulE/Tfp pilus assembly ATPase PilB-like protein